MSEVAKESVKKINERVSNEKLLSKIEDMAVGVQNLQLSIADMKVEIAELKKRTGFNDTPVAAPQKKNYNDDTGPWPNSYVRE